MIFLQHINPIMSIPKILIPASKSLSNRWLILQYLYPALQINNLSTAKDTEVLQKALKNIKQGKTHINIGHAGTAMRFLTALFSSLDGQDFVLEGSARMHQRPIKILVDALKQLGADISYLENEGYPPLAIKGKKLNKSQVTIAQNVSSQYISALMLIAPSLPEGLHINLSGNQVSKPYVQMTASILNSLGIKVLQKNNSIKIYSAKSLLHKTVNIEGDWSSASYFYGLASLYNTPDYFLSPFFPDSWQGDQKIAGYFSSLGIITSYESNGIRLTKKTDFILPTYLEFHLIDTPDLAQTLAVTCLALGIRCKLTGLQTLRIKETDRLAALQTEIKKLGANVNITDNSFELTNPVVNKQNVRIDTYDDHRMAMSFAILQKKFPGIIINNPEVVIKSFPDFWQKFNLV